MVLLACDIKSRFVMIHISAHCPGVDGLQKKLAELLSEKDGNVPIYFKQWQVANN